MIILKLICLVVGLSLIPDSSAQLPDITYTMGWYILPYTPMPALYNFLQALNKKDSTTKAKKERAQKFIDKNWGKPKIQNATYVNTKEKAQMHFANLISHRAQVKVFIDNFLMKQLLKLFNNKEEKAKELWTRDYMNYYTNTFMKGEW
ncbi:hypothetical protein WR25_23415 [Diploscapter pachys]|uniref:SXP/RAL-2 family protein Ani s 5-like cation-binding domain-containing protein n=1 Tax=Diploscapter pachys TaxID=2018661 RepID=A0A2A2JMM0_9BILA|nr:hypothetical protein WR25_23415 [Diploscapter pachys]